MTITSLHDTYISRCCDLALLGTGYTSPNPLVGAVIVYDNKIIGEGFHQQYGGHHAEVNAVNAVTDKSKLKESTLYVNLEPCSHKGKTPPCTDLIINSGIPEVVIGTIDPNPLVAGKGIKVLEQSGIKVYRDIGQKKCYELNKRFFTFHNRRRPYIILKWAQTSDGYIDIIRNGQSDVQPTWISNDISRMIVHKWRSEEQAILVGTHTALMDNPRLNVRQWPGRSPLRMVIDRNLTLPGNLHLLDNSLPTIVFNAVKAQTEGITEYVQIDFSRNIIAGLLQFMYDRNIISVLIEGGQKTIAGFIEASLWDEARVFIGQKKFGNGRPAPLIADVSPEIYSIQEDVLLFYRNNSVK
jgi:diaminohydroxyphosphoribosylaminopyrimidine deaminase / 5-amino-6-(5-phosphoribosylamino)uracil reductase